MDKIMQVTNVNKRFVTFPTMIKHEKHIDKRAKIAEKSNEFLRSLVKRLKIKFLHQNAIVQNEKSQRVEK